MPDWARPRVRLRCRELLPRDAVLPALKAGQRKASERGHIVTRIVCVSMIEAKECRRPHAGGCAPTGRRCLATAQAESARKVDGEASSIEPLQHALSTLPLYDAIIREENSYR